MLWMLVIDVLMESSDLGNCRLLYTVNCSFDSVPPNTQQGYAPTSIVTSHPSAFSHRPISAKGGIERGSCVHSWLSPSRELVSAEYCDCNRKSTSRGGVIVL